MSNIRYHSDPRDTALLTAVIQGVATVQDRRQKSAYVPPARAPYDFTRREKQLWAHYRDAGLSSEEARKAVLQYRKAGRP